VVPAAKHPPLLRKEHEDDPVHHRQDLLVVRPARLIIAPQPLDQRPVQGPVPELLDRPDHIRPETLTDLLPRLPANFIIILQWLLAGRRIAGEPACMAEPVERKELSEAPVQEYPFEVELDVSGDRRMMVVAQDPDHRLVHQHSPGRVVPVQAVLQGVVR
jgi:hypothetical protein